MKNAVTDPVATTLPVHRGPLFLVVCISDGAFSCFWLMFFLIATCSTASFSQEKRVPYHIDTSIMLLDNASSSLHWYRDVRQSHELWYYSHRHSLLPCSMSIQSHLDNCSYSCRPAYLLYRRGKAVHNR
ncbi:hypothetical protein E4T43_01290 [Aureobasidium subglaciale]|nr:hypothetical protein E4T43_01290 [Aureobasidium subglaciale]